MNFLAIDTTMDKIALALYVNGAEKAVEISAPAKKHNSALLPAVEKLLEESKASLSDIDVFGVVVGPGSFTGIRVGVAAINAFAFALQKPVVSMTSHEVARIKHADEDLLVLIDCKHDNFYAALFNGGNAEYMEITKKDISDFSAKRIFHAAADHQGLLELMKKKVSAAEFVEKAKPFYLKKSSAEREQGL
jgi:tRNA threonylcarbamoyladenosine biosynthesis protein TsaB